MVRLCARQHCRGRRPARRRSAPQHGTAQHGRSTVCPTLLPDGCAASWGLKVFGGQIGLCWPPAACVCYPHHSRMPPRVASHLAQVHFQMRGNGWGVYVGLGGGTAAGWMCISGMCQRNSRRGAPRKGGQRFAGSLLGLGSDQGFSVHRWHNRLGARQCTA